EPAPCADGTPARIKYSPRPHGNHNPQHGGQFFMAPDNWHHLEGVYPRAGVFRLHVYDDYSRPLTGAKLRAVGARVTAANGESALTVARGRNFLEARVAAAALPAQMAARVKFAPGTPEYRFDFTFSAYSVEKPPSATSGFSRTTPDEVRLTTDATDGDVGRLLAQLRERAHEIAGLID